MPAQFKDMIVANAADVDEFSKDLDFVFCAVDMKADRNRRPRDRLREGGMPGRLEQQGLPLDGRRPDDDSRTQPGAYGRNPASAQAPRHKLRLCRRQAQLLDTELCPDADPAAQIPPDESRRHHLSGDIRRGQDLRGVAGDDRQRHPVHRRRGGKIGAWNRSKSGASSPTAA
jgi:hypothetical protein